MQRLIDPDHASCPQIILHKDSKRQISDWLGTRTLSVDLVYFALENGTELRLLSGKSDEPDGVSIDLERDPIPLTRACGFVSTCDTTQSEVSLLQAALGRRLSWFNALPVEALEGESSTADDLHSAIQQMLAASISQLLARNQKLTRQAAMARRQFEHVQRTLVEVTQQLRRVAPDGIVTALDYPPATGSAVRIPRPGEITCSQRLPVSLRGLAGIDLYIDKAASASGVNIQAHLLSSEDKYSHARWVIEPSAMRQERIRLLLPVALDTLDLTPILTLTADASVLGAFRLGAKHPDSTYCVYSAYGSLEAPLAMRVRAGLPGRPIAHENEAVFPVPEEKVQEPEISVVEENSENAGATPETGEASEAGKASRSSDVADDRPAKTPASRPGLVAALHSIAHRRLRRSGESAAPRSLSQADFAKVSQISETPEGVKFGVVYHWVERSSVMVHPLMGSTTIACFANTLSDTTTDVTVWFQALRADGPVSEVSILAADDDAAARRALLGDGEEGALLTSGWIELRPGGRVSAKLFTSEGSLHAKNLYVASRLHAGAPSQDNAWVVVQEVHLR
ncbi:MAG: DUF6212 domain-containing protein [Hyphomicrobiaceae bacterium]